MQIRPERAEDAAAIATLVETAFVDAPHAGGNESRIVGALRQEDALALSLVAEDDASQPVGQLVGHLAFSPVLIDGADRGWMGLGPVAVLPGWRRQGIGAALIEHGLGVLRQRGTAGVVVLGDPAYYQRFGFQNHAALVLDDVPPAYFMALALSGASIGGRVTYHPGYYIA